MFNIASSNSEFRQKLQHSRFAGLFYRGNAEIAVWSVHLWLIGMAIRLFDIDRMCLINFMMGEGWCEFVGIMQF